MRKTGSIVAALALTLLGGCKSKSEEYCRQAITEYNQVVGATAASGAPPAANAPPGTALLPLEPHLSQCKELPEEAAHCAVLSYHTGHEVECRAHEARLRTLFRPAPQQ